MRIAAVMIVFFLTHSGVAQTPAAPANLDVAYRISKGMILRTEDGGTVWKTSASTPKGVSMLAWDIQSPDRIVAVALHAIYHTSDGGTTWFVAQALPPDFQPMGLTGSPSVRDVILSVGSDLGQSGEVIWRSRNGGIRWTRMVEARGAAGAVAVTPAETYWRTVSSRERSAGQ